MVLINTSVKFSYSCIVQKKKEARDISISAPTFQMKTNKTKGLCILNRLALNFLESRDT